MSRTIQITIVVLCCSLYYSCGFVPDPKNKQAVEFIESVNNTINDVDPNNEAFSNYLQKVGPIAINGENYQLEQTQIDTLQAFYSAFINSLDKSINKLSTKKELDSSFNILSHSINYLKIIKNSYVSTIPTYLIVYKIGWNKANVEQRKLIENGPDILRSGKTQAAKERELKEVQEKQLLYKY